MGRGIKKISENVIADKRSLILVTGNADSALNLEDPDSQTLKPHGIVNTEAMPLGMINVDYTSKGLFIKVAQGEDDDEAKWSKLDAVNCLIQESVTSKVLGPASVITEKIANSAVTTPKIADGNVVTSKLADQSVTEPKIADLNVTTPKLASESVTNDKLARDSVSTIKIRNNNVTTEKLDDHAVTTSKLGNKAVTEPKIGDAAVITRTIMNSAVTEAKIANSAVTEWKIADGAIHAHNIAVSGVSNANLQDACVSTSKIEDLSVTNEKLANETIVGSDKIAKHSITKDRLAPDVMDIIDRTVLHDGSGNVTGEGGSTQVNNLKATGDIYAHRVYNVVYMDIAEGYVPGEDLDAGDIVAMHEDGKVYKAASIHDCIVGVVSNEFANCLGASKEELFAGEKVAVGLIGKIHVKVKGPVRLGQRISVSLSDAGIGIANWMNNSNIGQALETIECDFDEINEILVQVRPM